MEASMVMNRVSIAVLALVWSGCSEAPSSERQQIAQSTEALSSQAGSSINNPIAFATTMPYANCQTHPAGQSTPRGQIVADDLGVARFHVPPAATWGYDLVLDCIAPNGKRESVNVNLQEDGAFKVPSIEATTPPPTTRHAFAGDLTAFTPNQFIAMGYPPPPSSKSAGYAIWKRIVTTDAVVPHAEPVAVLDGYNPGSETYPNWGGTELVQPNTQYNDVSAELVVPTVTNNGVTTNSSMWVGMGGDNGDQALIQAGVELDNPAAYYAWIEYWTNNYITVGSAHPNDNIWVECWPSDSSGNMNVSGGYATYFLNNTTAGWSTWTTIVGPGNTYTGATAEFIIEAKKLSGGTTYTLTDYGTAYMYGSANDTNGNYHDFSTDATNYIYTTDSNNLSMQQPSFAYDSGGFYDQTDWTFQRSN
jgi:hypothetical protein